VKEAEVNFQVLSRGLLIAPRNGGWVIFKCTHGGWRRNQNQTTNKLEETITPPRVYLDFLYQIKLTFPWKMI